MAEPRFWIAADKWVIRQAGSRNAPDNILERR